MNKLQLLLCVLIVSISQCQYINYSEDIGKLNKQQEVIGSSYALLKDKKLSTPVSLTYMSLPLNHKGNLYLNIVLPHKVQVDLLPAVTVVGAKQITLSPLHMKAGHIRATFLIKAKFIKGHKTISVMFTFNDKKKAFHLPVQMMLTTKPHPIHFNHNEKGEYVSEIWIHKGKYYAGNNLPKSISFNTSAHLNIEAFSSMQLDHGHPGPIAYISLKGAQSKKPVYLQMAFKQPTTHLLQARYDLCPAQNVVGCKQIKAVGLKNGSLQYNATIPASHLKGYSYIRVQAMIASYSSNQDNHMLFQASNQKQNLQYKHSFIFTLSLFSLVALLLIVLK